MSDRNKHTLHRLLEDYENYSRKEGEAFFSEAAFRQMLDYFEEEQEHQKALEVCEYAIQQYAYSADFYIKKASLLIVAGLYDEAISATEQARLYAPMQSDIELLYAKAMIGLGETAAAIAHLNELKIQASQEFLSAIYVIEAQAYTSEESHERAFYVLKAAVEANPSNVEAIERLGICAELTRAYEESIYIHNQILEVDAYNAPAWFNMGQAHEYLGNYREALVAYDYAYVIDSGFYRACYDCANLHLELKQYNKALQYFEELLNNFETEADSELHLLIGRCYIELERYQSGGLFLNQAVRLDPFNDEAYFQLGRLFAEQEKWNSAVHYLEKAIQIEDAQDEYYAALGEVYYNLEDHMSAISCIRKSLEFNEEEIRYWILLATFLIDAGEKEEALDVLEEADYIGLGTSELGYCRVACLMAIGHRHEALYRLGELLYEDFKSHETLFQIFPELESDPGVISLIASYAAG